MPLLQAATGMSVPLSLVTMISFGVPVGAGPLAFPPMIPAPGYADGPRRAEPLRGRTRLVPPRTPGRGRPPA